MKRTLAALLLLMWPAPAMATPVLSALGHTWALGNPSSGPMPVAVWSSGGIGDAVNPAPKAGDLLIVVLNADTSKTFTISGSGCTGGYWTQRANINADMYVFTATAIGGGSDPTSCTFTQSSGNIYDAVLFDTHQSDGKTPIIDTTCQSTTASGTSENGCTLTTSVDGEIVYNYGLTGGFSAHITDLGDFASVPLVWSGTTPKAISWEGVGAAGLSRAANYRLSASDTVENFQIAVAANNGSGTKTAAFVVTNVQPDGNNSVSSTGVMPLPYSSSPNTPSFPSGSVVGATVVAEVTAFGGTLGTVTTPSGWTLNLDQVGPSNLSEGASYCHTYTGVEGTQTWSFSGGTATQFFIQYAATNIPSGQCHSTAGTSTGSTDVTYTSPNAASDSIIVASLAGNNGGQLWVAMGNPTFASGYYGTTWGTCQLGGVCDHENYHTDQFGIQSGTYTATYSPAHGSFAGTAPTSIVVVDTLIGPVAASTATPLWPFP